METTELWLHWKLGQVCYQKLTSHGVGGGFGVVVLLSRKSPIVMLCVY